MSADQNDKRVGFLPFHAINEFMTEEYRLQVIRDVLTGLPNLPDNHRNKINQLTRKLVKVPGFRNSVKAPLPIRIKSTVPAFEKKPDLAAALLAAWADAKAELRERVYALLKSRNWELLPLEIDRTKLPGFMTIWPGGENFEILNQAFGETYPDFSTTNDDVSLMVVWISTRLPYQVTDEGEVEVQTIR